MRFPCWLRTIMWLPDCLTGTNPIFLRALRTSLQDRVGSLEVPGQLYGYLNELSFFLLGLCLNIFQVELYCILDVLECFSLRLAFAQTSRQLDTSRNEAFSLALERYVIVSCFHKPGFISLSYLLSTLLLLYRGTHVSFAPPR